MSTRQGGYQLERQKVEDSLGQFWDEGIRPVVVLLLQLSDNRKGNLSLGKLWHVRSVPTDQGSVEQNRVFVCGYTARIGDSESQLRMNFPDERGSLASPEAQSIEIVTFPCGEGKCSFVSMSDIGVVSEWRHPLDVTSKRLGVVLQIKEHLNAFPMLEVVENGGGSASDPRSRHQVEVLNKTMQRLSEVLVPSVGTWTHIVPQ